MVKDSPEVAPINRVKPKPDRREIAERSMLSAISLAAVVGASHTFPVADASQADKPPPENWMACQMEKYYIERGAAGIRVVKPSLQVHVDATTIEAHTGKFETNLTCNKGTAGSSSTEPSLLREAFDRRTDKVILKSSTTASGSSGTPPAPPIVVPTANPIGGKSMPSVLASERLDDTPWVQANMKALGPAVKSWSQPKGKLCRSI